MGFFPGAAEGFAWVLGGSGAFVLNNSTPQISGSPAEPVSSLISNVPSLFELIRGKSFTTAFLGPAASRNISKSSRTLWPLISTLNRRFPASWNVFSAK